MQRHAVTPTSDTAAQHPTPDPLRVVRTAEPSPANNGDTNMTNCTDCERLQAELAELRNNVAGLARTVFLAVQPPATQES